ncbi:MAG: helix-turn-helix domain-containing protein [Patescibacteria group bacterium]
MSFATKKAPCTGIENRPGCMQAALEILGDKWSPLLIGQLVKNGKTFGELELALAGISPRTLSARIDKLESEKVVSKHLYCPHPPRFRYTLTPKGMELQAILVKMAVWGDRYS